MLYNIFDDEPRRRMSTMIRLFVNLLRTGKLVTTDIVRDSQEMFLALVLTAWFSRCNYSRTQLLHAAGKRQRT